MRTNKLLFLIISLILVYKPAIAKASQEMLPDDFIRQTSPLYHIRSEAYFCAGGANNKNKNQLKHYPVIMISANKRTRQDWLGKNYGNAQGNINVYNKFIQAGFSPAELWLYQYTKDDKEMKNIEELTDGLKWFIYTVMYYSKSNKIQIIGHGEGAVLAQAAIKKYHLYNLIHALVYIDGPFHGSEEYTYTRALLGAPVCTNLAVNSDLLQDILLPDETPYNLRENENKKNISIKYMTIYNNCPGGDNFFIKNPHSPALLGAYNYELPLYNHDGLRCCEQSSSLFIPFLADPAIPYNPGYDQDKDGFMSNLSGGPDCDDNNNTIFPGAPEIADDNMDQDCNNMDQLSIMGKDCQIPIKNNY